MITFSKNPDEKFPVTVNFVDSLPSGVVIATGSVSATDDQGADITSDVLESSVTVFQNTKAQIIVKGGTDKQRCHIKLTLTLSVDGYALVENMLMKIDANI